VNIENGVIYEELRSWSSSVLEIPNPHLSGLPACPYAKKSWSEGRTNVLVGEDVLDLKKAINLYNPISTDVLIWVNFNLGRQDLWERWIALWNKRHIKKNINLMLFHPDYPPSEDNEDFLTDNEWESSLDDYMMVFIQSLSELNKASVALEGVGYYNHFSDHLYETLVLDRRRVCDGDG
jgi:hypothetical protein|tara:strand:- start:7696 stop:8232 length:537 start_codon:yes stop_codon:yes gene_type:complete